MASESRTGGEERPKLGLAGRLFLPKAPSSFPREGCSLKNFPCVQIVEQAVLLTPERPRPLPLAVLCYTHNEDTPPEGYQNSDMVKLLSSCSVVSDSATPGTVACLAALSVGFPRQEYWGGLPFPSPGDLPDPGIEPVSSALADGFFCF